MSSCLTDHLGWTWWVTAPCVMQLLLHTLQKRVQRKPMEVEEVAAAAEAMTARPDIAKARASVPTSFRCSPVGCGCYICRIPQKSARMLSEVVKPQA